MIDIVCAGDMRRLVDHMGKIEQPWNCPHGRPTIRNALAMYRIPSVSSRVYRSAIKLA
jgi:DNA mismatch repair ATPase MutL